MSSIMYELVLILRPDVSVKQISDMEQNIAQRVEESQGHVQDTEYWGLRTLAYRIKKRAKGHYLYFVFSAASLEKIYDYLKFHDDVLRSSCIRTRSDKLVLPSPLFHSSMDNLTTTEELTGDVA